MDFNWNCLLGKLQPSQMKKLTGTGPEISVHPGVTLSFFFFSFFFVTFLLIENREAACFTGDYST